MLKRVTIITSLLLTLGWAATAPVHAQVANVQTPATSTLSGSDPSTYTYPIVPTNGNFLVMAVDSANRTVSSVSGACVTYTQKVAQTWGPSNYNVSIWYGTQCGGDTTADINFSAAPGDTTRVCFWELSGMAADQSGATSSSANVSSSTTHNSGSVTPPTADNIAVYLSAVGATSGVTYDSGFTNIDMGSNGRKCGYRIQTAATAQEANHTSDVARNSGHVIAAFAGAAAAVCRGALMLLGVGGC
jgi:hypothetical protein